MTRQGLHRLVRKRATVLEDAERVAAQPVVATREHVEDAITMLVHGATLTRFACAVQDTVRGMRGRHSSPLAKPRAQRLACDLAEGVPTK